MFRSLAKKTMMLGAALVLPMSNQADACWLFGHHSAPATTAYYAPPTYVAPAPTCGTCSPCATTCGYAPTTCGYAPAATTAYMPAVGYQPVAYRAYRPLFGGGYRTNYYGSYNAYMPVVTGNVAVTNYMPYTSYSPTVWSANYPTLTTAYYPAAPACGCNSCGSTCGGGCSSCSTTSTPTTTYYQSAPASTGCSSCVSSTTSPTTTISSTDASRYVTTPTSSTTTFSNSNLGSQQYGGSTNVSPTSMQKVESTNPPVIEDSNRSEATKTSSPAPTHANPDDKTAMRPLTPAGGERLAEQPRHLNVSSASFAKPETTNVVVPNDGWGR
jgi:hypothetical protein